MKDDGDRKRKSGRFWPGARPGFRATLIADFLLVNASLIIAFALVHARPEGFLWGPLAACGCVAGSIVGAVLLLSGHYSILPRYLDVRDMVGPVVAGMIASATVGAAEFARLLPPHGLSVWLVPVLFGLLSSGSLAFARFVQRTLAVRVERKPAQARARLARSLLVGAGDAGETVVRELSRAPKRRHVVIGFVDDDPSKQATRIHGVPVLGTIDELPSIVDAYHIEEILILIPSASGQLIRRVFELAGKTPAKLRTLPTLFSLTCDQRPLVQQIRDVQIEDVLQREPNVFDSNDAESYITGEHVMITGGGGSIGSELARQVARLRPASLILLGRGENSIYEIEQELIQTCGIAPVPIIADVRDRHALERAFETYRPSVVFHAAAHKHVPLMQNNPYEAIQNNVVGTLQTAELAVRYGVRKFILLSTDKAVKPTSVMGATKRICEMMASAFAAESETDFAVVRFGNVLGSRGSLVPLLNAQIRRGGPVRLTHRDMTRFFMTIPEAVQLILQAGSLGSKGEVFILDMGEPIKVYDLAVDLIRLHGLVPHDDIKIDFIGIRPGEKVAEQLVYERERMTPTPHPKISAVENTQRMSMSWLRRDIETLQEMCEQGRSDQAKQFLMEMASCAYALPNVAVINPMRAAEARVE